MNLGSLEDPVLVLLQNRMKTYLSKEEQNMEQRIRLLLIVYNVMLLIIVTIYYVMLLIIESMRHNNEKNLKNYKNKLMKIEDVYLSK